MLCILAVKLKKQHVQQLPAKEVIAKKDQGLILDHWNFRVTYMPVSVFTFKRDVVHVNTNYIIMLIQSAPKYIQVCCVANIQESKKTLWWNFKEIKKNSAEQQCNNLDQKAVKGRSNKHGQKCLILDSYSPHHHHQHHNHHDQTVARNMMSVFKSPPCFILWIPGWPHEVENRVISVPWQATAHAWLQSLQPLRWCFVPRARWVQWTKGQGECYANIPFLP